MVHSVDQMTDQSYQAPDYQARELDWFQDRFQDGFNDQFQDWFQDQFQDEFKDLTWTGSRTSSRS